MTIPPLSQITLLNQTLKDKEGALNSLSVALHQITQVNHALASASPLPQPTLGSLPPLDQLKEHVKLASQIQSNELTSQQEQAIQDINEAIGQMRGKIRALQEQIISLKTLITQFEHLLEAKKKTQEAINKVSDEIKK
ncbi:MAG: hypothetical protein QRY72_05140 [Candidatus Rhabdochlamydia sp.]